MGFAIKKKWFLARKGSASGNMAIRVADDGVGGTVDEVVIEQVGTGKYRTASGVYKLANDPATPYPAGVATLTHDGNYVKKVSQYKLYYFDPLVNPTQWQEKETGDIIGVFAPLFAIETETVSTTKDETPSQTVSPTVTDTDCTTDQPKTDEEYEVKKSAKKPKAEAK